MMTFGLVCVMVLSSRGVARFENANASWIVAGLKATVRPKIDLGLTECRRDLLFGCVMISSFVRLDFCSRQLIASHRGGLAVSKAGKVADRLSSAGKKIWSRRGALCFRHELQSEYVVRRALLIHAAVVSGHQVDLGSGEKSDSHHG